MSKSILFLSHIPFDHWIKVGSNYIAEEFAKKGWKVGYLSSNISFFHLKQPDFKLRFKLWKNNGGIVKENIWQYVPLTLLPYTGKYFLNSDFVWNNWINFCIPNVYKILKTKEFNKIDIIFIDNLKFAPLLDKIKYNKLIFRLADKNTSFREGTYHFKKTEEYLLKKADYVLFASLVLMKEYKEKYINLSGKFIHFPNGVDLSFIKNKPQLPFEYKNIFSPRVIYIGAIKWWFDFNLMEYVIKNIPQVNFVFIGKVENKEADRLIKYKNTYFLGPKEREKIYNYLYYADVGIIPFNKNLELVKYIHPLKLYEYMACKLPVVSIKWDELELIDSPAYLADNYEDFMKKVIKTLREKNSNEYLEFAEKNSWGSRVKKIVETIKEEN